MVLQIVWTLIGFTIWSLRNIFTIFSLVHYSCWSNRTMSDHFWMFNFFIFTFIGYVLAVITIILIPGFALCHCYRETDRQHHHNPFQATGSLKVTLGNLKRSEA